MPRTGYAKAMVYGLKDPETGQIRYVGQCGAGSVRPWAHQTPTNLREEPGPKANWIQGLKDRGLNYEVVVLEDADNADQELLWSMEQFWISQAKGLGWPILNITKGGGGALGLRMSPESIAKIVAVREAEKAAGKKPKTAGWNKGLKSTLEHRAKISAALMGNTYASGNKGKPKSEAHKAAIAAAKAAKRAAKGL